MKKLFSAIKPCIKYLLFILFIIFYQLNTSIVFSQLNKKYDTILIVNHDTSKKVKVALQDTLTFSGIINKKLKNDTIKSDKPIRNNTVLRDKKLEDTTRKKVTDTNPRRDFDLIDSIKKVINPIVDSIPSAKGVIPKKVKEQIILDHNQKSQKIANKVDPTDSNKKADVIGNLRVWKLANGGKYAKAVFILDSIYSVKSNHLLITENDSLFVFLMKRLPNEYKDSAYYKYIFLEKSTRIPHNAKFTNKRIQFLLSLHDSLSSKNADIQKLADISRSILQYNDSSISKISFYKDLYIYSKASEKYWECIGYLDMINFSGNTEKADKERLDLLIRAINNDFKSDNFKSLQSNGSKYKKYFKDNFALRYKYGIACKSINLEIEALEEFEWLLNNWQQQSFIKWETALDIANQLYIETLNFYKSINLSRRLFTEQKNDKYLNSYLLSIHLFNCDIIAQTYSLAFKQVKLNLLKNEIPVSFPGFVDGFYLVNSAGIIIKTFYSKNPSSEGVIPFDKSSGSAFQFDDNYKTCSYIKKIDSDDFLVFEVNSNLTANEATYAKEILKNPLNSDSWLRINRFEEEIGLRFVGTSIANSISSTLNNNGHLYSYSTLLSRRPEIKYFVYYRKEGSLESLNYDARLAIYPEGYYAKSSKALAYFVQEVEYDKKELYEISIPVFNNKIWSGSLRIGITKL